MTMHANSNLTTYPLPGALAAYLRRVDAIAQSVARRGERVPAEIVLNAADFDTIDQIVRAVSHGRFNAQTVNWNGRHLRGARQAVCA